MGGGSSKLYQNTRGSDNPFWVEQYINNPDTQISSNGIGGIVIDSDEYPILYLYIQTDTILKVKQIARGVVKILEVIKTNSIPNPNHYIGAVFYLTQENDLVRIEDENHCVTWTSNSR